MTTTTTTTTSQIGDAHDFLHVNEAEVNEHQSNVMATSFKQSSSFSTSVRRKKAQRCWCHYVMWKLGRKGRGVAESLIQVESSSHEYKWSTKRSYNYKYTHRFEQLSVFGMPILRLSAITATYMASHFLANLGTEIRRDTTTSGSIPLSMQHRTHMHTHTHTHTRARTNARTHARTHTHTHTNFTNSENSGRAALTVIWFQLVQAHEHVGKWTEISALWKHKYYAVLQRQEANSGKKFPL